MLRSALFKSFLTALGFTCFFYSSGAYAANIPNIQTMIANFATSTPNLMRLVTAGSYVLGIFMVIQAIMGMKHFGEMRTMMQREHGMFGPILELLVGSALIYLPSSVQVGLSTFWTVTNPYAYVTSASDQSASFITACYGVVQLVGTVAFIRGLLILHKVGSEKAQPGMLSKAMAHLIGGILCINIYNTIKMLEATVGMAT